MQPQKSSWRSCLRVPLEMLRATESSSAQAVTRRRARKRCWDVLQDAHFDARLRTRSLLASRGSQAVRARRALAMKEVGAGNSGAAFNSRQAHVGMRNVTSLKRQQLINPMERGRLRKAQAVAQARRDAR